MSNPVSSYTCSRQKCSNKNRLLCCWWPKETVFVVDVVKCVDLTSLIAHRSYGSSSLTFPFGKPQLDFDQNPCTSRHCKAVVFFVHYKLHQEREKFLPSFWKRCFRILEQWLTYCRVGSSKMAPLVGTASLYSFQSPWIFSTSSACLTNVGQWWKTERMIFTVSWWFGNPRLEDLSPQKSDVNLVFQASVVGCCCTKPQRKLNAIATRTQIGADARLWQLGMASWR